MKLKELLHVIFQPVPPDQDESNSWVRYSMNEKKCDDKPAWQGYTPNRREWKRQKHWWLEALVPWLIFIPVFLFVIWVLLFVW